MTTATPKEQQATGPAAVWDSRHRRLTAGLLLTISLTAFEALAVATVLPAASADLGGAATLAWYGWVFSGFMLANLVGIPAAGVLAARGGTAVSFAAGVLLFAAGLVAAGLAGSMPALVAGRVAQGLGAGALSSVAYVAVAGAYPPAAQPRMLALLSSAWVLPGLLGPAVAALLAEQAGWRSVFLLLAPASVAAGWLALGGLRVLRAPASAGSVSAPLGRALRLAAGTALVLFSSEAGHLGVRALGATAGAALALPALAGLLPPGTLRAAPGAPAALAVKFLVTAAFFGAETLLPLALVAVRGQSVAAAGAVLTAGTLAWTGGAWLQERLVQRVDRVHLARAGLAMVATAIVGAACVLSTTAPLAVAAASWAAAGLGIGVAYSTTTLAVLDGVAGGAGQRGDGERDGETDARGDEIGSGEAASALQLVNVLGVAVGAGTAGAILSGLRGPLGSEASAIVVGDTFLLGVALLGFALAGRLGAGRASDPAPGLGATP